MSVWNLHTFTVFLRPYSTLCSPLLVPILCPPTPLLESRRTLSGFHCGWPQNLRTTRSKMKNEGVNGTVTYIYPASYTLAIETQWRNLYKDDIVYTVSLLWENVYQFISNVIMQLNSSYIPQKNRVVAWIEEREDLFHYRLVENHVSMTTTTHKMAVEFTLYRTVRSFL